MKTINLFVDFEFTSLSPDAQPISVGIVSEDFPMDVMNAPTLIVPSNKDKKAFFQANNKGKSFYAEFSDFDINRCDDWVKDNVVSRLMHYPHTLHLFDDVDGIIECVAKTKYIKEWISDWLSQFSDYQIQFVVDCGTWDWHHLLQLIGKWDNVTIEEKTCSKCGWLDESGYTINFTYKTGLPILPSNISPVPMDLNDLIAHKKGISVREAFDLNREELAFGIHSESHFKKLLDEKAFAPYETTIDKHNALFDAKVIKSIYEKLMQHDNFGIR